MSDEKETKAPAQILPDDVMEGLRSLINKQAGGDEFQAAQLLYNDNKQLRDKVRGLEQDLDEAQKSAPSEGAVVLSGEDAEKLRERGVLTDDGVSTDPIDEGKTAKEKLSALERKEELRSVAEAEGISSFEAFSDLVNGEAFDIREEDGDKYAVVTVEEDGEEKTIRVSEHKKYGREGTFAPALYGAKRDEKTSPAPVQKPSNKRPLDERTVPDDKVKQKQRERLDFNV